MTVIGASHIKSGTVCQDCSKSREMPNSRFVVICDGHGGADYFRSDRGSRFACEAFMDCAENPDLLKALSEIYSEKQKKQYINQLIKSIIARWNTLVEQDIGQNPFSEDELCNISERAKRKYESGEQLQSAYGTTLIGIIMTEGFWLGVQIGDGKCVAISENGEFSQPIPWDDECFLNITTSLCDENAAQKFRFHYDRVLPAAVFVASDGIDDCFAGDERLYDFYRLTLKSFKEADENSAVAQLSEYLPILSEKGSGDDMSVGILVNVDLIRQNPSIYNKACENPKNEVAQ